MPNDNPEELQKKDLDMDALENVTGGFDISHRLGNEADRGDAPPLPSNCTSCGKELPAPKFRFHGSLCNSCFLNIVFNTKRPQ